MRIHALLNIITTASLATATAACGGDNAATPAADTTTTDSASDTATGPGDDAAPNTDTDDTSSPSDTIADATAADTATGPDTTVTEPVFTADVTFNGTTTTVVPAVRRGLSWAARPIAKSSTVQLGEPFVFECAPGASALNGGRDIGVDDIGIAGNFNSICGTNLPRIDAAEDSLKRSIASSCNNKSSCTHNPEESFDILLGECQPTSILLTADYRCIALTPAPSFVFEATVGVDAIRVEGLDGLGNVDCADRAAGFFVNGQLVTVADDAPCAIDITARTEDSLAGSITATLIDGSGARHTLVAAFQHDDTTARPLAGINTGTDLCLTNAITHTVETEGDDTVDVFVTGPLSCQVNTATPLPGVGFRRVRPRANGPGFFCGEGVDVTRADAETDATIGGMCRTAAAASNGDGVLRFVFYEVVTCRTAGDCDPLVPIIYMQYDLGAPAN